MDDLLDKKEYPDASIDREYDYNLLLHVDSEDPKILDMALANAHNFIEALPDITHPRRNGHYRSRPSSS